MAEEPTRLRLIKGGNKPRKYHKRGQMQQWVCTQCEIDIGVATSVITQVIGQPFFDGAKLKISTGTKYYVCAHCLGRGKITRVT